MAPQVAWVCICMCTLGSAYLVTYYGRFSCPDFLENGRERHKEIHISSSVHMYHKYMHTYMYMLM